MADIEKIKQALLSYNGDNETLNNFTDVVSSELGEDWPQTIFDVMTNLGQDEQSRLDYVYRHFAAVAAWNEAQSYLSQKTPLDVQFINERIPILEHWLAFYQEPGFELIEQLKQSLLNNTNKETPQEEQVYNEIEKEFKTEEEQTTNEEIAPIIEEETISFRQEQKMETEVVWTYKKIQKEIELTKSVQAWTAARCIELENREVWAYPYYGFVMDLMRKTRLEIQKILEDSTMLSEIEENFPGEIKILQDYQLSLDKDIETAVQNGVSEEEDLLGGLTGADARRILGGQVEDTKEELGPAPDGFEIVLDSDSDLDEEPIKDEYSQIENVVLSENPHNISTGVIKNKEENEKNTSQTIQNSVKKKLSFSLGNKKPSEN